MLARPAPGLRSSTTLRRLSDPFASWLDELPTVELFDAHTHIGHNDPDGFRSTAEQLTASLSAVGARAAVFPMHEPNGYPAANDAVIEHAKRSERRLVAYCRLDPSADPLAEARRCLASGAAGIKLHPRAEGFALDIPELEPVFALADERRMPVLVHAGRGIPALGRHAVAVCERHPGLRLILAHAGICDLAWLFKEAEGLPNLFFDTAWWSPSDLLALFCLVAPGHILFASDAPYGSPAFGAATDLRYASQVGLSDEAMGLVFGGQLTRILAGEDPADGGPAPGPQRIGADPLLDRVHTFLIASIGQMFRGVEPTETLALTALACAVGDGAPQAEACATVLRLLELRPLSDDRPSHFAPGIDHVVAAACVARTPGVPMPRLRSDAR